LLPVIDLLVFDDSNPHGVVFQASVLARYLDRMARELGANFEGELAERTRPPVAFQLKKLEHLHFSNCHECESCRGNGALLRERTNGAADPAFDWLGMRYFTHVGDVSRQTMAL
jgi:uncharacterized alpha-E superfamily protein